MHSFVLLGDVETSNTLGPHSNVCAYINNALQSAVATSLSSLPLLGVLVGCDLCQQALAVRLQCIVQSEARAHSDAQQCVDTRSIFSSLMHFYLHTHTRSFAYHSESGVPVHVTVHIQFNGCRCAEESSRLLLLVDVKTCSTHDVQ